MSILHKIMLLLLVLMSILLLHRFEHTFAQERVFSQKHEIKMILNDDSLDTMIDKECNFNNLVFHQVLKGY